MGLQTPPDRRQPAGLAARYWWVILSAALALTACQPLQAQHEFSTENLLLLDPIDSITASTDMLAVFSFQTRETVAFRIDLLDFSPENAPSFYLLLDTFPGSSIPPPENLGFEDRWETVILILPDRSVHIDTGSEGVLTQQEISVTYDPRLDTVQLNLPVRAIQPPGPFELAIVSFDPSSENNADSVGPIRSDSPPPRPIPIVLALWNVFPAATPAQALRSWDGAHNGPAGERFGLRHLLEAVEANTLSVVLADLKSSESLAGLQLLGAIDWITELEQRELLSLPATLPGLLCDRAAQLGWPDALLEQLNFEAQRMGLQPSTALTCTPGVDSAELPAMPEGYRSPLIHSPGASVQKREPRYSPPDRKIIPLASGAAAESLSFDGGLSLDLRQQLGRGLELGLANDIFIWSADFQHSFWGDPRSVQESFSWIAEHPWIRMMTLDALSLPSQPWSIHASLAVDSSDPVPKASISKIHELIHEAMTMLVENTSDDLGSFTWRVLTQAFDTPLCLTQEAVNQNERASASDCEKELDHLLQAIHLLALVQKWEQSLSQAEGRDHRADEILAPTDPNPVNIYANDHWFMAIDPAGTSLIALFALHPQQGAIPLIWDPAIFNLRTGVDLQPTIEFKDIVLSDALEINIKTDFASGQLQLPIYLSPQHLQQGQTCLRWDEIANSLDLGCIGGYTWKLTIEGGAASLDSVLDSPLRWDKAEDPNLEMPAGHFLPIPYAGLAIKFDESLILRMDFTGPLDIAD